MAMRLSFNEALKIVGLSNTYFTQEYSSDELKRMRRNDLIKHHPDKGGNTDDFISISKAWDVVVDKVVGDEQARSNLCEACEGTGFTDKKTPFGYTQVQCKKCSGTGKKEGVQ